MRGREVDEQVRPGGVQPGGVSGDRERMRGNLREGDRVDCVSVWVTVRSGAGRTMPFGVPPHPGGCIDPVAA